MLSDGSVVGDGVVVQVLLVVARAMLVLVVSVEENGGAEEKWSVQVYPWRCCVVMRACCAATHAHAQGTQTQDCVLRSLVHDDDVDDQRSVQSAGCVLFHSDLRVPYSWGDAACLLISPC